MRYVVILLLLAGCATRPDPWADPRLGNALIDEHYEQCVAEAGPFVPLARDASYEQTLAFFAWDRKVSACAHQWGALTRGHAAAQERWASRNRPLGPHVEGGPGIGKVWINGQEYRRVP